MSRHPMTATMDVLFAPEVQEWAVAHEAWLDLAAWSPVLVGVCSLAAAFLAGVDDARLELKQRKQEAKDGGQESK